MKGQDPAQTGQLAASKRQREKIFPDGETAVGCIVCALYRMLFMAAQAAHGLPRTWWGCDHPHCVFPLCERHHAMWDGRAGSLRLLLLVALMSQEVRDEFCAAHGHAPNPELHPEDFDLLVESCPDTFEKLIQLIDPDWHNEVVHMYDEIEKRLANEEWPFARWEIPDAGHLPFKWVKRESRLTAHTVLCAVLFLSSAVLVKRKVDHWTEDYWWYFFRKHEEARSPENLAWYLENNPKFKRWFEEVRPDRENWVPPQAYPGAVDTAGDCLVCASQGKEVSGQATAALPQTLWQEAGGWTFTLCGRHQQLFLGDVPGEGLVLFPALLSQQARTAFEQAHGHPPDPLEHRTDLDVLLREFPSTFDGLAAILDPGACMVAACMLEEIERFLVEGEWPFTRSDIDCVADLRFDWVEPDDELSPYMVLAAILIFGPGVLVKKWINDWDEEQWWRFFGDDPIRHSAENLEWYLENNPRFRAWFRKRRPDEFDWSLAAYQGLTARKQQDKARARREARQRGSS
jgi:phage anti-repressor protein